MVLLLNEGTDDWRGSRIAAHCHNHFRINEVWRFLAKRGHFASNPAVLRFHSYSLGWKAFAFFCSLSVLRQGAEEADWRIESVDSCIAPCKCEQDRKNRLDGEVEADSQRAAFGCRLQKYMVRNNNANA